jgi:hypothetical protein
MPAQLKGREIAQNLELSASSIMTSCTHYRALLAPLAVGALTVDELSTGYSQLAGVLDALLGHDLPGHPLDCFWFTNLRDQCLRYALSLREPQPAAYLHARKHHLRGLKQTLRHQFVRLHGGWKLGTLLKDVHSLAQAQQCRGYGALAQLRDYGDCLDSLEPLLRCQCFAAASFNAADRFGHPLDLLRLTQALWPGPVSNPTSGQTLIFGFARPSDEEAEALLHDLETVCCLLQLNCLAVEHQLCTYTVVLEQSGSPRRALRNGDFTALAQHTRDSLNLLAWYNEQVSRSAEAHWVPCGREVARVVAKTQCTWFRSLTVVNGQLAVELSNRAVELRFRLRNGTLHFRRAARLYVEDVPLERVDRSVFNEWFDALVNDPEEPESSAAESDSESDDEEASTEYASDDSPDADDDAGNGNATPDSRRRLPPPPPPAESEAAAERWLAETRDFLTRSSPFHGNFRGNLRGAFR